MELGCGDGRVNFYAVDYGKVKKSIGIDIDEGILKQAHERLGKRYPQPPIEFVTADLLDFNHEVWEKVQEATIITMYFVEDALQKIRPILEEKLAGKQCRILTCAVRTFLQHPFCMLEFAVLIWLIKQITCYLSISTSTR